MIGHSPRRSLPLLINASDRHAVVDSSSHGGRLGQWAARRVDCAVVFIALPHAGSLNDSPRASTAQAMRAFLAAMATTAFQ